MLPKDDFANVPFRHDAVPYRFKPCG